MAEGGDRPKRGGLWRHRDFLKLWSAETISQIGTQITLLALPLTAILILDATPFQVGLLTTLEFLPFILVGLPAGVWVDRLRRRPILIAGDVARALVLGFIPVAHWLGILEMWHLFVAAFLAGIGTVFFDVAYQAYLPSLVGREHLVEGNSKLEMSRSGAHLAGPGMAGALVEVLSAPVAILLDAITYLWSALFVLWIRQTEPAAELAASEGGRPSMRQEIGEGVRYVWGHRLLRPIAFCTANANFFGSMAQAVLILFAVRTLELSPGVIGAIFAIGNVGFLLGAVLARRVADRFGIGRTIVASAVVFGLAPILVPLATPAVAVPLLLGSWFVGAFANPLYNINQVSLRQAITPDRMQGRMNATMRFMVWGTMPLGAFLGGTLGSGIGVRTTLWVGVVGGLFSFVFPLLSPVRTLEGIPQYGEVEPRAASSAADDGVLQHGHLPSADAD